MPSRTKSLQLSHGTTKFKERHFPITIIADGLKGPANVGALFRICEAFGVEHILFYNTEPDLRSNRLLRTSRNTHQQVQFSVSKAIKSEIASLKEQGYTILALEITNRSKPIQEFTTVLDRKLALIIGNERIGISQDLLLQADQELHIEMFGKNSSMNVVQATAIALYSLTKI